VSNSKNITISLELARHLQFTDEFKAELGADADLAREAEEFLQAQALGLNTYRLLLEASADKKD
jgi:hypothetical protein